VRSVPVAISVEDTTADVLGVALVGVAVVGLALDDLRAAALGVGPVAALARPLVVAVLVVIVAIGEGGDGEEGEAEGHDEQQLGRCHTKAGCRLVGFGGWQTSGMIVWLGRPALLWC
jgi:hypothetical protein